MTILITGSTGAFGRLFSKWWERYAKEEIILTGRTNLSRDGYVQCDMKRPEEIRALITQVQPRLVFHLAGCFANDYEQNYTVNVTSAKFIFDTLLEENLSTRVVLFGSAAEYGAVTPEENPLREDHALRPVSAYGLTKAYQTQLAYYYAHYHNIDVIVARIFNLLVPGLSSRLFVGRVEHMINQIKHGETDVIELGNLESMRDYVTGEEAISQINRIAKHGQSGEVYHVGSGRPIKMKKLLNKMLNDVNLDWSVVRTTDKGGTHVGYDVPIIYANMDKTNALFEE
jgi:nucleoside-diphosphate-sugar epimerase